MKAVEEIIETIIIYKEDHPEVVITDEMIKDLINDYINSLIKEIKEVCICFIQMTQLVIGKVIVAI